MMPPFSYAGRKIIYPGRSRGLDQVPATRQKRTLWNRLERWLRRRGGGRTGRGLDIGLDRRGRRVRTISAMEQWTGR